MFPLNNYSTILKTLKERIHQTQLKASLAVNAHLLIIYWEIGNALLEQQKAEGWGAKTIERLAIDLKVEFPDLKGLSVRNLQYMRAFAEAYPDCLIVQPAVAQLQNTEKRGYYICAAGGCTNSLDPSHHHS